VQSSLDRLHKRLKYRDMMEQLGGVVAIPVFAYYTYSIPFTLTKIASVLIILWGIQVIIRLRNAKKHKPGAFTETYLEYLYKTREYIKIQKQMLDNVVYWYILPAMVLVFLFVLGPGLKGRLPQIMKVGALNIAMAVAIYFLNKRAVRKELMPRLEKVDELINVMEGS
jgi:hypothetical protein